MKLVTVCILAGALLAAASARAAADPVRIVVLGDSLTAGYGLANPSEDGFPARLEAALRAGGHDVAVVDAGVSGDTTAGGLARVDWSVGDDADGVIVELGANDMLRGLDPAVTARNLDAIVARLTERGMAVLVAGMRAAPNLGPDYAAAYDGLFADVAARHDALLHPFFLEGVAAEPALNQADGIHPNADGVGVIVDNILPAAEALIDRIGGSD